MSRPEQPGGLTRKQLREIRMTGATPIVDPDAFVAPAGGEAEVAEPPVAEPVEPPSPSEPESVEPELAAPEPAAPDVAEPELAASEAAAPVESSSSPEEPDVPDAVAPADSRTVEPPLPAPVVHLARAAEPVVAPAPRPDAHVDLGVAPLTRRQAREQERIRTASVPVITPDVIAAHSVPPVPPLPAPVAEPSDVAAPSDVAEPAPESGASALADLFETADGTATADAVETPVVDSVEAAAEPVAEPAEAPAADSPAEAAEPDDAPPQPVPAERAVLRPEFGSELLSGMGVDTPRAPSFDELIARSATSTGSVVAPNALILSQTPGGAPLDGPVTATGEVLITGTLNLPEGLGSRGHAVGAADGKDVDAVLIDGELPPASSPTPIAASAAISTVKGTGEIIRPPAPEKGNRLMLSLAITAGVLAVALVGVLILALVTGVF